MFYNPRLEQCEIDRLYNADYLANIRKYVPSFGGGSSESESLPPIDRAIMIADIIFKYGGMIPKRILDYGGSNGYNLRGFDNLSSKYVLDLSATKALPGVSLIEAISEQFPYDLIVCTHVLEHLVNLREVWDSFVSNLSNEGLVYIEVPYDFPTMIKQQLVLGDSEHINFFSKTSIFNLGQFSNLECLYLDVKNCTMASNESNTWDMNVIYALFKKTPQGSAQTNRRYISSLVGESTEFLYNKYLARKAY